MIIEAGAPHQAHDHNHDQAPTPHKNPEKDKAGATVPMVTKKLELHEFQLISLTGATSSNVKFAPFNTHQILIGVQLRGTCKCGTPVMHTTA